MDMGKLDKLEQCISDLDHEVVQGLMKRLLAIREAEWRTMVPVLQQECDTAVKKVDELIKKLENVRQRTIRARSTANEMSDLHKEIEAGTPPSSLADQIKAIVEASFALGKDLIQVDHVQDQLVNSGVILAVQNPAAVIASILARDRRLKRIHKGQFGKRILD